MSSVLSCGSDEGLWNEHTADPEAVSRGLGFGGGRWAWDEDAAQQRAVRTECLHNTLRFL